MERKVHCKNKKKFLLIYLAIWLFCAFIGFLEAGVTGFLAGLGISIGCSLIAAVGLIPFAGIFVFILGSSLLIGIFDSLGAVAPISTVVSYGLFFILSLILCAVTSLVVILLILAIIVRSLGQKNE